MPSVTIIIICLVLAFLALISVSVINTRQTRARLINQRLAQQKRRVGELEELASAIESLSGSSELSRIVLEETIDTLKSMLQLDKGSQLLEINLDNALQRLRESQSGNLAPMHRLMDSDAGIAKAQFQLSETGRIVRRRQAAGLMEVAEMNQHIQSLAWANLMVTVISLTASGHKALRSGDVFKAFAYYRKAQQAASGTNISDERRHRIIKELGEIINNKRKSLSLDLMPESQFNPDDLDIELPGAGFLAEQPETPSQ
jgi:hypothetical protein